MIMLNLLIKITPGFKPFTGLGTKGKNFACAVLTFLFIFIAVTAQLPSGIAYFSKSGILVNPVVKSHCTTESLLYLKAHIWIYQ